ncbi:hypothetical protein GCM10010985_52750 [Caballeronia grimmiae]|uniref:Uncharacterized protein n=1 Tax=Caballeronia grimmiae TaxID=1071679 RepID=A0ABQ1S2X4_9BURK|nr:hypothetical protein GCM10010985_52750 [Caballeronia grimmiae]
MLRGRERVIENDEFDVVRFAGKAQFFDLSAADEHFGVRTGPTAGERNGRMGARTFCEQAEFFETGFEIDLAEIDAHKRCVNQIMSG